MPLDALGAGSWIDPPIDFGCRYIVDGVGPCGTARRSNSSYCLHHHGLCHVTIESAKGAAQLREFDAVAHAVGRRLSTGRLPTEQFLERLTQITAKPKARPISE